MSHFAGRANSPTVDLKLFRALFLYPNERFKHLASLFRRHSYILREPNQHPFRLQKRSGGGHFSPGTFDTKSQMKASKKNFILDFFRHNKRNTKIAPMDNNSWKTSKNFHSVRIPFVPVRIAKRNAHYSPSIGPQAKRNYRNQRITK